MTTYHIRDRGSKEKRRKKNHGKKIEKRIFEARARACNEQNKGLIRNTWVYSHRVDAIAMSIYWTIHIELRKQYKHLAKKWRETK